MRYFIIIFANLLLIGLLPVNAMSDTCDGTEGCSSGACCPNCQLEIKLEDVKKYCYDVGTKTVCIPKVNFPWQVSKHQKGGCDCSGCDGAGCDTCCGPDCPVPCKGAKVRCARVLKKYEYQCKCCKYKWTPNGGGCDSGCCDAAAEPSSEVPQPPEPKEAKPKKPAEKEVDLQGRNSRR